MVDDTATLAINHGLGVKGFNRRRELDTLRPDDEKLRRPRPARVLCAR